MLPAARAPRRWSRKRVLLSKSSAEQRRLLPLPPSCPICTHTYYYRRAPPIWTSISALAGHWSRRPKPFSLLSGIAEWAPSPDNNNGSGAVYILFLSFLFSPPHVWNDLFLQLQLLFLLLIWNGPEVLGEGKGVSLPSSWPDSGPPVSCESGSIWKKRKNASLFFLPGALFLPTTRKTILDCLMAISASSSFFFLPPQCIYSFVPNLPPGRPRRTPSNEISNWLARRIRKGGRKGGRNSLTRCFCSSSSRRRRSGRSAGQAGQFSHLFLNRRGRGGPPLINCGADKKKTLETEEAQKEEAERSFRLFTVPGRKRSHGGKEFGDRGVATALANDDRRDPIAAPAAPLSFAPPPYLRLNPPTVARRTE